MATGCSLGEGGKICKRKVVSIEKKLEICRRHKIGQLYASL